MRLLFRSRLVVLDTEATGIFGRDPWAEVIELGAVCLDVDGFEIGAFSRLVKPAVLDSRADGALAVNKIRAADLERQPGADVVAEHFLRWLRDVGAVGVTAFVAPFDRAGLDRMGLRFLSWDRCVMQAAMLPMREAGKTTIRRRFSVATGAEEEREGCSLAACAAHFGIEAVGEPHRALTDARTAAGVLCAVRRRELERLDSPDGFSGVA